MIFIILSGLALAVGIGAFVLSVSQKKRYADLEKRIGALEKGAVPDFEKAKAAAEAVNDFNSGISGILGFDPYQVLKAQRGENTGGEGR